MAKRIVELLLEVVSLAAEAVEGGIGRVKDVISSME